MCIRDSVSDVVDVARDFGRTDFVGHVLAADCDLYGAVLHLSLIHISEPTRPY